MKISVPTWAGLFLLGTATLLPAFSIPTLQGEWQPVEALLGDMQIWEVAGSMDKAKTARSIELEPGSHYLFVVHQDPKAKKVTTRVYFSGEPAEFGLSDTNPEAMHMVGEFDAAVSKVIRAGDAWSIIANGPDGAQAARIQWKPFVRPVPALPGTGRLRVALYDDSGSAGKGIPNCTAQLGTVPDMEVVKLNADGVRAGLSGYHVVIFTGGSGSGQARTIGLAGREQVRQFVEAGGGYVGICAGAYLACDGFKWSVHVLDAKTPSSLWERGHADLEIETNTAGQSLLGLRPKAKVIYHNGPIINPANNPAIPDFEPLVIFRTEVSKTPKHAGLQINTPAMVRGSFGKGKVLVSSPHPEQTAGMEHWIEKAVRAVAP